MFYIGTVFFCLSCFRVYSQRALPLWSWECMNNKCVPVQTQPDTKLQSLTTCKMLCASVQIWPHPTGQVSLSTTAVPLRVEYIQLKIITALPQILIDHINDAFRLMLTDLKSLEHKEIDLGYEDWRSVLVLVTVEDRASEDARMRIDTDESYRLSLHPTKSSTGYSLLAHITGKSFCGVRHAFETFSQLIWFDSYRRTFLILEAAQITDKPRFYYRGLMIDTAGTYIPMNEIMRTLDAMGSCKLNTFHWHASDSQTFSLRLNSVNKNSQCRTYSPGALYSLDDIRAVVRRARLRGIRVIIEVDTPAHVGHAWGWGEQAGMGILAHCIGATATGAKPWLAYCNEPPCGQLNPHNSKVFELLEHIYAEIIQLTGVDDVFHIGGNDISEQCWQDTSGDVKPMNLWIGYTRNVLRRLEFANGKLPNLTMMWMSNLTDRLKTDFQEYVHSIGIQARSVAWTHKHVSGVRSIISHGDAWDLNNGMGAWYEESDGAPYIPWQRIYEYRPWARKLAWRVEGGEVTVWSSSMSGGSLESHTWPRASALAERLWTDQAEGASRPVQARMDMHRSRLVERGIKAAPIFSMWCTHNPYTC